MTDPWQRTERVSFEKERGVTEIKAESGVAQALIQFAPEANAMEETLLALKALHEHQINNILLKLAGQCITFVVDERHIERLMEILPSDNRRVTVTPQRALISVFAANIREMIGVMATIAETLHRMGISMEQTGDAHDRVMVVIDDARKEDALKGLEEAFGLEGLE